MQLTKNTKIARIMNAVAAGQTNQTSSAVDMAGFEGALFLVHFGAITAGAATSVKLQQSSDDGGSDNYSDLEGTSVTVADTDDNKIIAVDIKNPGKRYLKCLVLRATQDSVIDGITVVQYGARVKPPTHATSVATLETHVAPAEGTA